MGLGAGDVKKCVAYGMITSDMGLLEIPHVPAPASVGDLRDAMRTQTFPEIAPFPIHFIPGVRNFAGPVDLDNFRDDGYDARGGDRSRRPVHAA